MVSIRCRQHVRSSLLFLALILGVHVVYCAEVQYPLSIAIGESGVVYVADRNLPGLWKLEGGNLTVFFEGSQKFRTPLNAVRCVAIDPEGKVWAGDSSTREIYRIDGPGQAVGLTHKKRSEETATPAPKTEPVKATEPEKNKAVEGNTAPSKASTDKVSPSTANQTPFIHGEIGIPMDIAFHKNGDLYVSDLEIHRIVQVARDSGSVKEFAKIQAPRGLCFDAQENLWVISGRRLVKLSPQGEQTTVVADGTFEFPHTVAIGPDQTAYICDGYAKTIWKVSPGGKPEKFVSGEPFLNPVGLRFAQDKLFVVDPRAKALFQISLDKQVTTVPLKTK